MTFGIFVAHDGTYFQPVADITMPVLKAYCDRHGYALDIQVNPPVKRTLVWDRVLTMLANLHRYTWTVHFDADILITNHKVSLEELVVQFPDTPMVLCRDHTGLNDGMIFNRQDADLIWNRLWSAEDAVSSLEATWRYVAEHSQQKEIGEVPQKLLHSYPYHEYGIEYPQGAWERGDFAYHLPGMTTARRVELLKPMIEQIIY